MNIHLVLSIALIGGAICWAWGIIKRLEVCAYYKALEEAEKKKQFAKEWDAIGDA